MKNNPWESSLIKPPHKVEGAPKEARESFYELAKNRIKYLNRKEYLEWVDVPYEYKWVYSSPAMNIINAETVKEEDNLEKWVDRLEIAVNKDAFKINEKDYSDLIPFVAEHEIYEAWLTSKKGAASTLERGKKHLLAQRRAFFLAEEQGLGDKFLEWVKLTAPTVKHIKQCEYALKVAKKQLARKK